ncbi:MAG: UTP--glucose-1-phosphate uridylyltransferase [Phycisphaerales bacterium]
MSLNPSPPSASIESLRRRLSAVGQDHVLKFYGELSPSQQDALRDQLSLLDLESLPALVNAYVNHKPAFHVPHGVEPAPYYSITSPRPAPGSSILSWDPAAARSRGEALIRAGKVAAFVVAGGQGSRLGYEGPKGCFPAGAVTGKPLFQMFAEQILAVQARYGSTVPWYVMTSPLNHDATVGFFQQHAFFGLGPSNVMFFPQGTLPSLDIHTGRMLMASTHEVATNPDGHGGSLRALHKSGAIADMKRRGVEHISYFQVDNPIVRVVDPVFLGLHADPERSSAEMSSKMIPKAYPEEKLGMFCATPAREPGHAPRIEVIEYSDLPADLQAQRLPSGSLRFLAGSIAVHVISVAFVDRVNTDASFDLPYHRAEKKIPCIDPRSGSPVNPASNNGVKLERFVFDSLPLCRRSVVLETNRIEEFAPIKNATGVDSPDSSRQIQTRRAARWLAAAGIPVPLLPGGQPDCTLEIDPRSALEPSDIDPRRTPPIIPGAAVVI